MASRSPSNGLEPIVGIIGILLLGFFVRALSQAPTKHSKTAPNGVEKPYQPKIAAASSDALDMMKSMKVPDGFETRFFAAEPMLANPVAFWFDTRGRCFVAETFRQDPKGVPDNRDHAYWVDDDLAAETVDDRRAMYLKHHPEYEKTWTVEHDRIRLLVDENGDGQADKATVFADGFKDILDGTGAGVMTRGEQVYYTCIPDLWIMHDADRNGRIDNGEKESVGHGFGVRVALRGHDMHGLVLGPDGRIYFSIGDRGYNVQTREGKTLFDPKAGAVFRMNPDGSELEIFATGLRNPQELAFDDWGNLLTGDNNGDGGDQARVVYVVEGGETGWRMNFQTIDERGPWTREGWWKPHFEGQAAFLIPPLANVGAGPSGLTHYPGTGFPERYDGHFFLCDFRGDRNSSVKSFALEPSGAGYKVVDEHDFLKNVLPTDCDFATDGTLAVADWVEGWNGAGKGRIYKIRHRTAITDPVVAETARLLGADQWSKMEPDELAVLLGHRDRRVRLEAQFALADGDAAFALEAVAKNDGPLLARVHAIWGLEQIERVRPKTLQRIVTLLDSPEAELRAQTARVFGDALRVESTDRLIALLADPAPRVRYFAALTLGKFEEPKALVAVAAMLRENADKDVFLRHAGVMALTGIAAKAKESVYALANDPSPALRMAVLLTMRRYADPKIAAFLDDKAPFIAVEAARAIHDLPIKDAWPALAAIAKRGLPADDALARRALAACEWTGGAAEAEAVAAAAANRAASDELRIEALKSLRLWGEPRRRDPVMNDHRPRLGHSKNEAVGALRPKLGAILREAKDKVRVEAAACAADLAIGEVEDALTAIVKGSGADARARVASLDALGKLKAVGLKDLCAQVLSDADPRVRGKAASTLATIDPIGAIPVLERAAISGAVPERQSAFEAIAMIDDPRAAAVLVAAIRSLIAGTLPRGAALEALEAARRRAERGDPALTAALVDYDASLAKADIVDKFGPSLEGGDAARGEKLFKESAAACLRCHALGTEKSKEVGPALGDVGVRRDRRFILASILDPNREVLDGYKHEIIETKAGETFDARILKDAGENLEVEILRDGDAVTMTLNTADIVKRNPGLSSMPQDVAKDLKPKDLRDIVEFLAGRKEIKNAGH